MKVKVNVKEMGLTLLALVLLTACGHAKQEGAAVRQDIKHAGREAGQMTRQAASGADIIEVAPINSKADHLKSIAKSIPEVSDAYCLTVGNLAIVAIDVEPTLDRSKVDTIKYSVAEALKKDPDGASALVTADLDLTQNVREISAQVSAGHPIAAFTNELGDILGRLIPQLPQDTVEREEVNRAPAASPAAEGAPKP